MIEIDFSKPNEMPNNSFEWKIIKDYAGCSVNDFDFGIRFPKMKLYIFSRKHGISDTRNLYIDIFSASFKEDQIKVANKIILSYLETYKR